MDFIKFFSIKGNVSLMIVLGNESICYGRLQQFVMYVREYNYVNYVERQIYFIYFICKVKENVMYGIYKCV